MAFGNTTPEIEQAAQDLIDLVMEAGDTEEAEAILEIATDFIVKLDLDHHMTASEAIDDIEQRVREDLDLDEPDGEEEGEDEE